MLTVMVLFNRSANLRPWFKHPNLYIKQVYWFASLFTFLICGSTSCKSAWQSFGITCKSCSTVAVTMVGKPRDLCPTQSSGKVLGSFMDFVLLPCTELISNCAIVQSSSDSREENACYKPRVGLSQHPWDKRCFIFLKNIALINKKAMHLNATHFSFIYLQIACIKKAGYIILSQILLRRL